MADPSFFVGIVGNVISILVFASPIGTFRRIVRSKSTEEFRWLPYVTTLLCTSLWTFYGLLKPGGLLIVTVNGAGAALEAVYVALYLAYAPRETKAKMGKVVLAVNVGALAAVVAVALTALHGGVRLFVVGVLCAALTIGMYAAPMAAMRTVVKTRSVEYMPFSLSFFLFLNGGVWSVYSLLVKDFFIGVPNAIGFALGTAQLALYMAYRRKKPAAARKGEEDEEEAQGVARLIGQVEMAQRRVQLHKGLSLPKPAAPRHGGLDHIMKSFSTTPVELHSILHQHHGGAGAHHHHRRFDSVPDDEEEAAGHDVAGYDSRSKR
ncbi:bidirectional sugar transporter SWEET16 [Oryza brachyantha]|uniref:Bidirectional sugar transporter SWEET n=1 Tax=Oryza brachyantha TaxID=4533 RepID=J3LNM6_ORYBR|nr:bidirectional sugar transporter SWEET16 [Oryza brachyantha]